MSSGAEGQPPAATKTQVHRISFDEITKKAVYACH